MAIFFSGLTGQSLIKAHWLQELEAGAFGIPAFFSSYIIMVIILPFHPCDRLFFLFSPPLLDTRGKKISLT
jgi:hypothetical protein